MKTDEYKDKGYLKILGLVVIVVLFVFAFILLINKHTANLGDVINTSFNYQTIPGNQLVAKDKDSIYPRYFVVFFNNKNNKYIIHSFNYYETGSQYDLEYSRNMENVIDYNVNENMLRIKYSEGYGSYTMVKNNLKALVEVNNLEIYE